MPSRLTWHILCRKLCSIMDNPAEEKKTIDDFKESILEILQEIIEEQESALKSLQEIKYLTTAIKEIIE